MSYFGGAFDADPEDSLTHYGVKGMKWGVRRPPGVSRSTNRTAKKDAKEYARAKMFYGEGAGTRRKLINNTVKARSAKDPSYKTAFDNHLNRQDMSKHASKARSERGRKDAYNYTSKTARGVKNIFQGNGAPVTISALVVAGAASNPKVRATVSKHGKSAYSAAQAAIKTAKFNRMMKNVGLG